jgi:hypothetical protein
MKKSDLSFEILCRNILLGLCFSTLILALGADQAWAKKRFALIIGNGKYEAAGSLKNAANDAQLIDASFKAVGFETELLTDLSEKSMGQALDRLAERADSLDVVALYYAGHAIQKDGQNYLIPIDAQIKSETAIERETIALQSFMKVLERVPISLLFLDACRNNPFAEQIAKSSKSSNRAVIIQQGLAVVRPVGDMLITFATLPNAVAFDGIGENSPFASSLSQHIKTPNVEISVLMKRVTRGVIKQTKGKQRPQQLSQMQSEFYFVKNSGEEVTKDPIKSILSVYPAELTTGEEVALVADVPNSCAPAFFDMSQSGKITPIPKQFFKQAVLPNGQARYEISPGSRYGLIIQEQDARGPHILGYFCEPDSLDRNGKVEFLKALKVNFNNNILRGKLSTSGFDDVQFHFQSYLIR